MKKEILKEIREPGKSRKKKGQPKGRRNGFLEGLTGKDFTAAGLFFFSLLLCRLFVLQYGVFGSSIDWISQHSTLADYFRKRFYATGNLFPDFAWNLGGGQNIYRFAYYGLLSPTMLLSYLFPFIPMDLWVMGSSALLYAADAVLFYRWISKKGLHYGNCLFTSLFFTCSTALLYHSYNQLMFVNYMPFLCMALWGVDSFLEKGKPLLYLSGVFLMIMTSFYFSIGGILVLILYGLHRYFMLQDSLGKKIRFLDFLRDGIRFLGPILTAILLSAFFLVPTAMALHGGREGETTPTDLSLFIPTVKFILDPLSSLCNRTDHTDPDRFDRRTCLEEKRRTDPDLEHDPDSDDSVLFLSAQWRTVHPGQGSDSVSPVYAI